jgi:hypothetical protein
VHEWHHKQQQSCILSITTCRQSALAYCCFDFSSTGIDFQKSVLCISLRNSHQWKLLSSLTWCRAFWYKFKFRKNLRQRPAKWTSAMDFFKILFPIYQIARRRIPERSSVDIHRSKNLEYHTSVSRRYILLTHFSWIGKAFLLMRSPKPWTLLRRYIWTDGNSKRQFSTDILRVKCFNAFLGKAVYKNWRQLAASRGILMPALQSSATNRT